MGTFFIVGTPIGNLKDITLRALEVLKTCDIVLAEDTRVTKRLLNHYEIKKPVWRYDEYAGEKVYKEVENFLKEGKNIVLVTDAGTPGIADPGWKMVKYIRDNQRKISIIPIPGASSVVTLLSASGINGNAFTFLGYPPHKKGRNKFFEGLKNIQITPIVFFESPYRVQKSFDDISRVFGGDVQITIGRELTKVFEEIWSGTAEEAKNYFVEGKLKGEFVIAVNI